MVAWAEGFCYIISAGCAMVRGVADDSGGKVSRFRIAGIAAMAAGLAFAPAAIADPIEECAAADVPVACLDVKLKEANKLLNDALKRAQERIEQLQGEGRRQVQTAFVNSQRAFNAYRDAQCAWQAIHAAPGESGAPFVKACQIVGTVARAHELQAFARGEAPPVASATTGAQAKVAPEVPAARAQAAETAPAQAAAEAGPEETGVIAAPPASAPVRGGLEWRLERWIVDGNERALLEDSEITTAFDPSGKISGNASLNSYNGRFSFDINGRLQWRGPGFAVTRMAGPAPLMAQERAFLESLRRMVHYRTENNHLILESTNGKTVLTFVR